VLQQFPEMDIITGLRVVDKSDTNREIYRVELWQNAKQTDERVLRNRDFLEKKYMTVMREKSSGKGPMLQVRGLE